MKKSQLIEVLTTLNKSEAREFKKWLCSPVHNQREDVVQLFDYLMTGNHLSDDKFLEKERIYRKIFGKEAYNDAKLRQTSFFLNRALEEYLIYKESQLYAVKEKLALISTYRKKNLQKPLNRALDQAAKSHLEYHYRNEDYFRNEYMIQQEKYNELAAKQKPMQLNLQDTAEALDKAYIIEKLVWSCRMLFHKNLYRTEYDLVFLPQILTEIKEKELTSEPAIATYYYVIMAITNTENPTYFEKLRSVINQHGHLFPPQQKQEIYLMIINYCIRKMNAGIEPFYRVTFEWYRQGIVNDILTENNRISPSTYLNTVTSAIKAGEFSWAKRFVVAYKQMLPKSEQENLSHFSEAKLFFEQKDYRNAMRLLIQVEYNNILMNLNAKAMLLKMYYEQDEIDVLESLLESMRTYMRRKKVIGYHKNIYKNLIQYTKKLIRINPFNKDHKTKLRQEIETADPLPERQWLLEQLERA